MARRKVATKPQEIQGLSLRNLNDQSPATLDHLESREILFGRAGKVFPFQGKPTLMAGTDELVSDGIIGDQTPQMGTGPGKG